MVNDHALLNALHNPSGARDATCQKYVPSPSLSAGVKVVAKSLVEPTRWIAENGGEAGYVITTKVAELPVGHGYNAKIGEYQNLIENGVIDPVKVTRSALANAASIASLLLTTETLVVDKRESDDD